MPEGNKQEDPKQQAEAARKAFEQEFGRFAGFQSADNEQTGGGSSSVDESSAAQFSLREFFNLSEAETALRELGGLRSRHTGKKSALASVKKMIGRVEPNERAAFGQRAGDDHPVVR